MKTYFENLFMQLILINDQLIIFGKANFFNLYFTKLCTSIESDSSIPPEKSYLYDPNVSLVDFGHQDIIEFN